MLLEGASQAAPQVPQGLQSLVVSCISSAEGAGREGLEEEPSGRQGSVRRPGGTESWVLPWLPCFFEVWVPRSNSEVELGVQDAATSDNTELLCGSSPCNFTLS